MTTPPTADDRYADLPASLRRANLEAHRQALLSDRMAADLHRERTVAHDPDADVTAIDRRIETTDTLLARTAERIGVVDTELAAATTEPAAD